MVLTHDDEATPPGSIIDGGENDGVEYGAETREDLCKLGPGRLRSGETEVVRGMHALGQVEGQTENV